MTMPMTTSMITRMVMRRASIAEVKAKLSMGWLGEQPVEITANNVVVATITPAGYALPNVDPRVPARTGVAAPTPITPAVDRNLDPRVPPNTGTAHPTNTRGPRPRAESSYGYPKSVQLRKTPRG